MKPQVSEFSYGYALTGELIHWQGTNLTAVPISPSLYQEGQLSSVLFTLRIATMPSLGT